MQAEGLKNDTLLLESYLFLNEQPRLESHEVSFKSATLAVKRLLMPTEELIGVLKLSEVAEQEEALNQEKQDIRAQVRRAQPSSGMPRIVRYDVLLEVFVKPKVQELRSLGVVLPGLQ